MSQSKLTADISDDFFPALMAMAVRLDADPRSFMAVWFSESGMRAAAWNDSPKSLPPEKRYNSSGLFQAMPATLRALGYPGSHTSFRALSATQQIQWALRYYMPYKGKLVSVGAIYVANFLPALLEHAGDPSYVMTAKNGVRSWAFLPNQAFDANGDMQITVGELESAVQRNARGPRWEELAARLASAQKGDAPLAPPDAGAIVYAFPDPVDPPDDVA